VVADLKASSEQSSGGTDPLGFLGAILPPILAKPGRRLQGYVTSSQKALCLPSGVQHPELGLPALKFKHGMACAAGCSSINCHRGTEWLCYS